jgi:hypothetical protein
LSIAGSAPQDGDLGPAPTSILAPAPTRRQLRDQARGYSINRGYVTIAYVGEIVLIVASLVGAWIFAQKYGDGGQQTLIMMMLAPISYAVVEMCRVPMAIAFRTQTNILLKTVLFIGLVCAAGVTVKSLAQLGEQMFQPRLIEVTRANERLAIAKRDLATFDGQIAAANARTEAANADLRAIDQRVSQLEASRQSMSSPRCYPVSGVNRRGERYSTTRCEQADPRLPGIENDLRAANAERVAARERIADAQAEAAKLDRAPLENVVSSAATTLRDSVLGSQLHSFTAMAFLKAPGDVTEREIHAFLFFFVFFPAIFASVAATLLALGSVTRIRQPPQPVALSEQAGAYVLGPLAEHIIRETTEAVHKSAQAQAADASQRASAGPRIKAVT